jgi:hypothetical protein
VNRARLGLAAAVTGTAAVLAAGYAAAGPAGLIDAAALAAIGALIVARGMVRGERPRSVRSVNPWRNRPQTPAVSAADFPSYRKIASDLAWAQLSMRHYEYILRPMLARLAAARGRPEAAAEINGPAANDVDGPGVNLATLERLIAGLEGTAGADEMGTTRSIR